MLVLFGGAAFGLYAFSAAAILPRRTLLATAATASLVSGVLGLMTQTAQMTGSVTDAINPGTLWIILSGTGYGAAWIARMSLLILAFLATRLMEHRPRLALGLVTFLSGAAVASLAWSGHGAATEGSAGVGHLAADVLHLWAAGLWVGALEAFSLLAFRTGAASLKPMAQALAGFSGIGSLIASTLVLTGLVNAAFLVPLNDIGKVSVTPWAQLLAIKLVLFTGMLGLAAANRFLLTPRLTRALLDPESRERANQHLRISLLTETGLAVAVLCLVAWLGTLAPP